MEPWQPDQTGFQKELEAIEAFRAERDLGAIAGVLTSRDTLVERLTDTPLYMKDVPSGFNRWLLPFIFNRSHASIISGLPDSVTPTHSHEDHTLHFVVEGTVSLGDRELDPGDWAYVAPHIDYSLKIGPLGAKILYFHGLAD